MTRPLIGTFVFFWVAPATVAFWVPYSLTGWGARPPLFGFEWGRVVGAGLAVAGLVVLLESFARFALEGRGTLAPVAPTAVLVVNGLYRHVRNPMYLGVFAIVAGQALFLGQPILLGYAAALFVLFHVFVLGYEERALRRQFGASYATYRAAVRRWWPRLRPWAP